MYTTTREVARARNRAGFRSDAGVSAGTRGAIDGIATAEMGRQNGWSSIAGVARSAGQRRCLLERSSSVGSNIIADEGNLEEKGGE